jgi:NhaP-type Na+/H+ or K+/H+ antiporter
MLLISLPIAIAAGWAVAYYLLPGAGVWLALLVAAALAATDAGLGAATILNPIVPVRVRRLLNGESGLNDGLATPVVLFAISAATVDTLNDGEIGHVVGEALLEIVIGLAVGVLIGYALGRLLHEAELRGWAKIKLASVGVAVMPLLAFFGAELVHGNGFIAAFISGTAYAAVAGRELYHDLETTEDFVTILSYATWTLFGAIFVSRLSQFVDWRSVVYALLSLTVLRMIPILFSLLGSGLARPTKWFLAWFGPRGLATVVFTLIAYESIPPEQFESDVAGVLSLTVLFSVIAHGITAPIFARKYGAWAEENQPAMEMAG